MGEKEACSNQTVIIDIPEELEHELSKTCWILRVPRKLRQVNEAAYTPKLISIGPIHHGKPTLNVMEKHKNKYYDKFWERDFCKHMREKDIIRDFTRDCDRRHRIQNCYAGTVDHEKDMDHFLEVILLDSCFIFELFLRNYENRLHDLNPKNITDHILRTPWLIGCIALDLIMLENQLPYFVFVELFDFILENQPENSDNIPRCLSKKQNPSERHNFIMKMTCEFFSDFYDLYLKGRTSISVGFIADSLESHEKRRFMDIKHFTDLVRQFMLPNNCDAIDDSSECHEKRLFKYIKHFTDLVRKFMRPNNYDAGSENNNCRHSAKELHRAGVDFVPCSNKFLTEIKFNAKANILEVPRFRIEDTTECLMRNVMALEQCLYPYDAHICNYISLLDQLIDTEEDVALLVKKKIVDNWLGSNKAVADLVNKLCDEIWETSFCYGDDCEKLNKLHDNFWNETKATLKRVYFKDIWTGSSTIVAVVVVIFSIFSVAANIKDMFF